MSINAVTSDADSTDPVLDSDWGGLAFTRAQNAATILASKKLPVTIDIPQILVNAIIADAGNEQSLRQLSRLAQEHNTNLLSHRELVSKIRDIVAGVVVYEK